jgi:hypothetical protein
MRAVVPVDVGAVEERLGGAWTPSTVLLAVLGGVEAVAVWHLVTPALRPWILAPLFGISVAAVRGRPQGLSATRWAAAVALYALSCRVWIMAPCDPSDR